MLCKRLVPVRPSLSCIEVTFLSLQRLISVACLDFDTKEKNFYIDAARMQHTHGLCHA